MLLSLGLALCTACTSVPPMTERTQVLVLAAIHSAHKDHPAYSYEDLYGAVRRFSPDVVGVEIRQEDLHRDGEYLARNYPLEMRQLASEYAPSVRGFDWLGPELEGRPVPDDWWAAQSPVKRLEREQARDADFTTPEADALQEQQMEIVRSATAAELNDGRYDAVTRAYYRSLASSLAGTRYAPLAEFYGERDRKIAESVTRIVADHPGRRIAIVLGADHRAPVIDALRRRFGRTIELVPVR
jgi:hypothetical protein